VKEAVTRYDQQLQSQEYVKLLLTFVRKSYSNMVPESVILAKVLPGHYVVNNSIYYVNITRMFCNNYQTIFQPIDKLLYRIVKREDVINH